MVKRLGAGEANPLKKNKNRRSPYHHAEYTGKGETAEINLQLCEECERERQEDVEDARAT